MQLALLIEPAEDDGWSLPDDADNEKPAGPWSAPLPLDDPLTTLMVERIASQMGESASHVLLYARSASQEEWSRLSDLGSGTLDPRCDDRVEDAIARGARLLDESAWDAAREAYLAADVLLAHENSMRRAEVFSCLASIERERGEVGQAAVLLDRALAIFPAHRGALQARIELARTSGDAVTLAALLARQIHFAESVDERVTTLTEMAHESLRAVGQALTDAVALRPGDPDLLNRLRAVYEAAGRYDDAVNASVALAEAQADPGERARTLVSAAKLCTERVGNVGRAVALYEAAIADDPGVPGAFEAIEAVLENDQDWPGLERAYARQLERIAGRRMKEAEIELLEKLAELRAEELENIIGAIQALDRLLAIAPDRLDARMRLIRLLEATGQDELGQRCLEVAARLAPTEPAVFQGVHRIATRRADPDRSYCACAVLVHLGEADIGEQMMYQQYAPEASLKAVRPLEPHAWELLFPDDYDAELADVLRAIEPVAVAVKLDHLRQSGRGPRLDPSERQDPERSTLSAVRTVGWAAHLMQLPVPDVYAKSEDIPGGIAALPAESPALLLGKAALVGRSLPELSFMVTREFAYLRAAGRLLSFYPSLADLDGLIRAMLPLFLSGAPRSRDVSWLELGLASKLDAAARGRVAGAITSMVSASGKVNLKRWLRTTEIAACRAAFLACDDITVAARILSIDGRVFGDLSAADKVRDLIAFSVSQRYHALRSLAGFSLDGM